MSSIFEAFKVFKREDIRKRTIPQSVIASGHWIGRIA